MFKRPRIAGMSLKTAALTLAVLLSFSGCSMISVLDLATAGRESKQKALGERVTKFHRELYWATDAQFMAYIEDSKRPELGRQLRQNKELEKLVDLEVRELNLRPDDSDKADVEVKVRYYKKASLMVSERFERETWEYFRFRGGWLLVTREVSPTTPVG